MKKVLLTGASGFIGRYCIPFLQKKGYEVYAAHRRNIMDKLQGVHWIQLDLLEYEQLRKVIETIRPTHLLHLAWDVTTGKWLTSSNNLNWIQSSLMLMDLFSKHSGKRIVMAGTCFEYDLTGGLLCEQNTLLKPNTLYGGAKLSLNIALEAFAKQMHLSSAWGRIFYLYGPNEYPHRFVPSVILGLLKNQMIPCTHCNQVKDFMYVEDVAEAMVELLDSSMEGAINIASGVGVSLKTIINNLEEILQVKGLVQYGALDASKFEPSHLIGNTKRLNEELKWHPKWSLKEGLAQTIHWWNIHK